MNHKSKSTAATELKRGGGLEDILFILFKHKWKIFICALIGFSAAAFVYSQQRPVYQSKAKLLVRYVRESNSVDRYEDIKSPGGGGKAGDAVINTEIEIFNSLDLARQVAITIGVEKLVPEMVGMDPAVALTQAASAVLQGLEVVQGKSSNVLHIRYGHADPQLAQQILNELVERYFERHLEIHRSAAAFEVVAKQAEEVRLKLQATDRELNQLRTDSGIVSLGEATSALATQRARTQEDLIKAKAELAELQASIKAHRQAAESVAEDAKDLPLRRGANGVPKAVPVVDLAAPEIISEYRATLELLAFLQKRDLELRVKFKAGHRLIALNQEQMSGCAARRRTLLARYPGLASTAEPTGKGPGDPSWNGLDEQARLAAVSAKIEVFEAHLREIGEQFSTQFAVGARIEELDRRKQMEDAEYRSLEVNLKTAKINQTLDPTRMPNITIVQQPSVAEKTFNMAQMKIVLGLAGGGLGLGLGLAFLIELLLVHKVSRPIEIQTRLQLPLLLSIPYVRKRDRKGLLLAHDQGPKRLGVAGGESLTELKLPEPSRSNKQADHFILPYAETIRDRIVFSFEVNNVTHRPTLVAVTGLSEGAGTSTVAAGLARSFAELKGVKVLLVDLSSCQAEEHPLFGEIPRHSLHAALNLARNTQFRKSPQGLYYASANARRDPGGLTSFSPMHLNEIMPHLQASEYDYIIFDMPPVEETSRTLTMAGMMDKVLLVLDAENTSRDGLIWGYGELVKGRADVSCVFNKTRSHVPTWLMGGN